LFITIRKNLGWLAVGTLLNTVGSFFYGVLVARHLGPALFGQFALITGVTGGLIALAQGGGTTALTVLAAQDRVKAHRLFWPGILIQTAAGIAAMVLGVPIIWVLARDRSLIMPTLVYGVANLGMLTLVVPVAIFRGLDRMEWGLSTGLAGIMLVGLTEIAVRRNLGLTACMAVNAVAVFVMLAVTAPIAHRALKVHGWDASVTGRLAVVAASMWGVAIIQSLHWRVGLLSIQLLGTSSEVGIYSAATKLIDGLKAIPWFLLMAVLPSLIRTSGDQPAALPGIIERSLQYSLSIAFVLSIGLSSLAPIVIHYLYTPEYHASTLVLFVGALGLPALFASWVALNAMISSGMISTLVWTYTGVVLLEGTIDLWTVPLYGAVGAAWAAQLSEASFACVALLYLFRKHGSFNWKTIVFLCLVGLASIALVPLRPQQVSPFLWAGILCISFIAAVSSLQLSPIGKLRTLLSASSA
jgi:PST family polysaccharide transporter